MIFRGDTLVFGKKLRAKVTSVDKRRLLGIRFESPDLLKELYRHGRPIQYSYHRAALDVWDQQTIFSGPPVAVEPPSASLQFSWQLAQSLQEKGIILTPLLHSAGISSTGDKQLDEELPLAEWYEIPQITVDRIAEAKAQRRRVVALGTTVTRALESAAASADGLQAGRGLAVGKIAPNHSYKIVDGLITGMHEPGSSHLQILTSLCSREVIDRAYVQARERSYLGHEYGDLSFLRCVACGEAS